MGLESDFSLINVGYGNKIVASRIIAILVPSSAPLKRMREAAKNAHKLIDARHGRKTRSVVLTDSEHIILSAIHPETIAMRFENACGKPDHGERELSDD